MLVFEQVLILFSFVALGYSLGKTGMTNPQHSKILSSILVNIIVPFGVLNTFWRNCTVRYLSNNFLMVMFSLALLMVLSVVAFFGGKLFSKHKYEQRIYEYSLVVPNIGYMGYPLTEAIYGATGLMDFMMFCLPLNIYIYLYAYPILTKTKANWKTLCNPMIIALLSGVVLGISGIQMPDLLSNILVKGNACMGPISMLLAGIVLSEYNLKEIIGTGRIYIMSALRLLVLPLSIGGLLCLFTDPGIVRNAVLLYSLPCGLNTVVFPNLVGENCKIGAGLALISHLAACLTIPLVICIFQL